MCDYIIDSISKAELLKRDEAIQELTTKYNKELNLRKKTEQQKEQVELQLVSTILTQTMTTYMLTLMYYRKTHNRLLKIKANR